MFSFDQLRIPVVAAPMAGGPSTPELVAAVGRAGGLGFLAAGYRTPEELAEQVSKVRGLGVTRFGVNLFCPPDASSDRSGVDGYARLLQPIAGRFGVELGEPRADDDHWDAKIELLASLNVPVVSFTFGLPDGETVGALKASGTFLLATVTSLEAVRAAEAAGIDGIVVQGPDAGGHQATLRIADPANALPLPELLIAVRRETSLPLVAAGGITRPEQVQELRALGAVAVQVGTGFMLADEAGTSPSVRAAYRDPRFTRTVLTRAFSGRLARGLANEFSVSLGDSAPAAYPEVNLLTGPIRGAASRAEDLDWTHLWAGTRWREAREGTAASILAELWPES